MPRKEDRRVCITKQAIRESLIDLLQEYPISKISVKMICDVADINRSTFYAHYKDQNDLLDQIQQEAIENIKSQISTTGFVQQAETVTPVIVKVLEYCKENRTLFEAILSQNGDVRFQRKLMRLVQEKTIDELRDDDRLDPRTTQYFELFMMSGILSMIRKWLEDGCIDTPVELAELMIEFLYNGIFGLFQKQHDSKIKL